MTINDIISKRLAVSAFYTQYLSKSGTSIAQAVQEPLKLRELQEWEHAVTLPTGKVARTGEAMCYCCLASLIKRANRTKNPSENDIGYMAEKMIQECSDWSVLDLPTFVDHVIMARVPSPIAGSMEYQLVTLDCLSIMGKVASYNRMRPNREQLQGMSPSQSAPRHPLSDWQLTHLFGGRPHTFASRSEAERYWFSLPDKNNPEEMAYISTIVQKYRAICK